ncbi:MAG: ABC transporter substrate-binding protein, partial [Sphaerochaetaceae bacterium]
MKKHMLILALIAAMALLVSPVFATGNSEEKGPKIGFIGPMTGDYANYGVLCSNAVKLAVEEYNAKGGVAGKLPVSLIVEDSEGNVEKGLSAIEKLSSSDKVCALVGPVFTGVSFAVGKRVQSEGLPMITPSATHKDITAIGNCVFRTVVSDGLQGEVAGKYFYEVLGYRNIAVLYAKNDYSQGLYEGMTENFQKAGGKVIVAEACQVGDKDFKTQLTKIKAAGPEAIYIPDYTAEMAQILEQARELGITVPFLSCDGFSNPEIFKLAGGFTKGVVYVGPAKAEESAAHDKFVKDYTAKYGIGPDSFATNSYDASYILFAAMEKAYAKTGKFER